MPVLLDIASESNAFTVINHEEDKHSPKHTALPRNVNVVKPLQRDDGRTHLPSAAKEQMTEGMATVAPQTILDPKFTRALDFKLRRLKEKEILEANLRRPTRNRRRPGTLAFSNPNLTWKDQTPPKKMMSQSQPRIDTISSDNERAKMTMKLDKSPVAGKNRGRAAGIIDTEKPRFITTVKTGQFLLPPPEVACLLGLDTLYPPQEREKIVYSYASKPKAVTTRSKRSVSDKKSEVMPNGVPPGITNTKRVSGGELFKGVRSIIAGVAGMKHLLEKQDHVFVSITFLFFQLSYCNIIQIQYSSTDTYFIVFHSAYVVSITDAVQQCLHQYQFY